MTEPLDEDYGGRAAVMDQVEGACMRLYDSVLDALGTQATPAEVTRVAEAALEAALHVTEREGSFEASHAILQRLDWFTAFAPR